MSCRVSSSGIRQDGVEQVGELAVPVTDQEPCPAPGVLDVTHRQRLRMGRRMPTQVAGAQMVGAVSAQRGELKMSSEGLTMTRS
jgi:hypothetical protein